MISHNELNGEAANVIQRCVQLVFQHVIGGKHEDTRCWEVCPPQKTKAENVRFCCDNCLDYCSWNCSSWLSTVTKLLPTSTAHPGNIISAEPGQWTAPAELASYPTEPAVPSDSVTVIATSVGCCTVGIFVIILLVYFFSKCRNKPARQDQESGDAENGLLDRSSSSPDDELKSKIDDVAESAGGGKQNSTRFYGELSSTYCKLNSSFSASVKEELENVDLLAGAHGSTTVSPVQETARCMPLFSGCGDQHAAIFGNVTTGTFQQEPVISLHADDSVVRDLKSNPSL